VAVDEKELNPISEKIIGASFIVSNTLGVGFLEKVYENALAHEIRKAGLSAQQDNEVQVFYDGIPVGLYKPDLLVDCRIIVELKSAKHMDEIDAAQAINYLKATGLPMCLLINFGKPRIEIKRFINNF
jgi:GxxExxY protein